MKIAFLLTQSLDSPSGLGRFGPLARELARLGHSIEIFALHPDWEHLPRRSFEEQGVRVSYVAPMHVRKHGSTKQYYSPARLLAVTARAAFSLAQALSRSQAEVVQVCKPQPMNALAARLARRGRPVFVDCDDYEAATNRFQGAWQKQVVKYFEDGAAHYAAGITTNTCFTRDRYQALGYPASRLVYVPNGVERQRFSQLSDPDDLRRRWGLEPDDPLVVYAGTLGLASHPVDLLLQAFVEVLARLPRARLLLAGGGEDFENLQKMAAELGLGEAVIFAGRVHPDEVPGYLRMATVTVDPVHDDLVARARSPLKVVESLACGVPVVTANVGDRRSMLAGGEAGVLVKPGDSHALAEGLLQVLEDPAARQRMAQAALEQREYWYWDRLVEQFMQVYELGLSPDGTKRIHS